MSSQKELLVACSAENRIYDTDGNDDDMPLLICLENSENNTDITDFEKYKEIIFEIIGKDVNYTTVDPAYKNIKKVDKIEPNYIGHLKMKFEYISDDKLYDYIVITSAYMDFFDINISKIKKILKPDGLLLILCGVPYNFDILYDNFTFVKKINKFIIFQ